MLTILNIGIDRSLLVADSEAVSRQSTYARELPARLVHVVKATPRDPRQREVGKLLSVHAAPVRHWLEFYWAGIRVGDGILRRERIDLVQVQDPYLTGPIGAWLAYRHKVPLVVGAFSDEIDNPVWIAERVLNRVANLIGKYVLGVASAVRTDSRAVAQRIQRIVPCNVFFVPFMITNADGLTKQHPDKNSVRDELLAGRTGPLLLAVTRLEPEKNVQLMIEAISRIARVHPGVTLALAGDGGQRHLLEKIAAEKAPGCLKFLGWVENTQLPALYQAADLTLLTSDRESAARVLTETLLAGTPIVTTDTAGAREVVEDDLYGKVTPVGDAAAFADAVLGLLADPVILAEMGRAGQVQMTKTYHSRAVIDGLKQVYTAAIADR